jgi:hypothetical protein
MAHGAAINVGVVGHDGVSPVFKKIGHNAHGLRGMLKTAFAIGPLANGMTGLVESVAHFGEESVNKFEEVGKEIIRLRRITGGSAEDVSKMRFAFEETGLSVDDAARSIKKFATAAVSKNGLSEIGVKVLDTKKKLKPMNQLLLETADKFAKMPAGVRKTAEVVKLFGRNGLALLPFLNKGSKGLKAFFDEAEKYGLVFNDKDLKATQDQVMAQREFNAALSGFQVQLGRYILPYMTKFLDKVVAFAKRHLPEFKQALAYISKVFRRDILPPLKDTAKWIGDNKDKIVAFAKAILPLIVMWKAYTTAIKLWNVATKVATGIQLGFNAAQRLMGVGAPGAVVPGGGAVVPGGGAVSLGASIGSLAASVAALSVAVAQSAAASGGAGLFAFFDPNTPGSIFGPDGLLGFLNQSGNDRQKNYGADIAAALGKGLTQSEANTYADAMSTAAANMPLTPYEKQVLDLYSAAANPMNDKYGSLPPIKQTTTITLDGKVIANSTENYLYRNIKAHGRMRLHPL